MKRFLAAATFFGLIVIAWELAVEAKLWSPVLLPSPWMPMRWRPSSVVQAAKRMQTDRSVPRPMRPRSWCSCDKPNLSAPSTSITVAFGTSMPTSITVVDTRISMSPFLKLFITRSFSFEAILP